MASLARFAAKKVHILFSLLIIASIASFYYEYRKYDAYYLPWTRAFELLIGAWFALITGANKASQPIIHTILPTLALLTVLITLALPPEFWPDSKSLPRLIICFATAYLLASGSLNAGKIQRLLSLKVLVVIGLWSYSLYLWHWPILSLLRYVYMNNPVPLVCLLIAIAATFVLSYCSYRFVEHPVRKMSPTRQQIAIAIMAYLCLFSAVIWLQKSQNKEQARQFRQSDSFNYRQLPCGADHHCGRENAPTAVLTIGDSHVEQYYPFFDLVGQRRLAFQNGIRQRLHRVTQCAEQFPILSIQPRMPKFA